MGSTEYGKFDSVIPVVVARFRKSAVLRCGFCCVLAAFGRLATPPSCASQQPHGAPTGPPRAATEELRPGDIVRLRIWREPDLSGDFRVDESHRVILPRLGPVDVGQLSLDSLKHYLLKLYQTYLRNPTIEVTLLRQVKVTGAVRNPGSYPADPGARVADVIALAGGVTPDGKQDEVELVRQADKTRAKLRGDTLVVDTPIRSGDQLYVPQKSWVSRNPGLILGAASVVTGLLWAIGSI